MIQQSTNYHENKIPEWITTHHTSTVMKFSDQLFKDIDGADMRLGKVRSKLILL